MTTSLKKFQTLYNDLFEKKQVTKHEFFIKKEVRSNKLALIEKGIMRGFLMNEEGEDINILFFKENDFVSGNLLPNLPSELNIQAIENCTVWIADFNSVTEIIKSDKRLTALYNTYIDTVHTKIQNRLVSLIEYTAIDKYRYFLKEYPTLINRIPHYHVANFLGITPTQLSRIRKEFVKRDN